MDLHFIMIQLNDLIRPIWSVEKSLNKAWSILTSQEKEEVKNRVDKIFYNELPFQLEHDKLIYVHLFSLFTQLEIIALRGLIRFLDKMSMSKLYVQMRQQITDEVFHATLFAKIAYQLSAPFALPLGHQKNFTHFASSIENEEDLTTAFTLVNLIGEGWVEELCLAMKKKNIAVSVFEAVLEDESRHLNEYDLYKQIGLPNRNYLKKKLALFEGELINAVLSQEQYIVTFVTLLGKEHYLELINKINEKQHVMLNKINISPSKNWQVFMKNLPLLLDNIVHFPELDKEVEFSNTRKLLSSKWSDPELPTQSAVFDINVSSLGFFEKKLPSETLTCLMLQALSKGILENPKTRNYIFNHKIYHAKECYVALTITLPGTEQLGSIEFKNCHEMSIAELAQHIKNDMNIMLYCYKKTKQLQEDHPYLKDLINKLLSPRHEQFYNNLSFAMPAISLSNIGQWGYKAAISPLFPHEVAKLTLTEIERKQVWNPITNQFEIQDILPIGISVDHRVFDGNTHIPRYIQEGFDSMFAKMQETKEKTLSKPFSNLDKFINQMDTLLANDLEGGFLYLFSKMHVWKNYMSYNELVKTLAINLKDIKKDLLEYEN